MADVFISYSRKDKDLVRALHDALKDRGRETWVDWEDIPPTAEWLKEIFSAIEAAHTFAFVISPDSVASDMCKQEIAHAVKHNKRLVPIVRRDAEAAAVPEALAKLQWIFFREGDDFSTAFQSLMTALDTDLDWVHAHTRLLTRAIEWHTKGRETSFVLRGRDLTEAEQWFAQAADKEPKPTSLQSHYVLASRSATTRRQRLTLGAITFGLVVALVLAAVAFIQRQEALRQEKIAQERQKDAERAAGAEREAKEAEKRQRQIAEQRRRIAVSRQLAAQAQLARDSGEGLELSALLAMESLKMTRTLEGYLSWADAMDPLAHPLARMPHGDEVRHVAFSPDGTWLATASNDATARVWEAATGKEVARLPHEDSVLAVAFSPDGKWLATASKDGTARIWELGTDREVARMQHEDGVRGVAFSPDGKWLATGSLDGTARVWDAATGRVLSWMIFRRQNRERGVWAVAFSPDGKLLATTVTRRRECGGQSMDERCSGHTLHETDRTLLAHVRSEPCPSARMASGWRRPGGRVFGTRRRCGRSIVGEGWPGWTMLGLWISVLTGSGWRRRIPITLRGSGRLAARLSHEGELSAVAFSPDGKLLATGSSDKTARVWNVATAKEAARMSHKGDVKVMTFSPDGRWLATGYWGIAQIWEAATGRPIIHMSHQPRVNAVSFSPDGKFLATASGTTQYAGDGARVWEAETGREVARMTHGLVELVTFSQNGKWLATGGEDGTARVWLWRPEDLTAEACSRLTRNLTPEEWGQYLGDEPYRKTLRGPARAGRSGDDG